MEIDPLLGPVVVLVAWTLVMMIWMAATRFPAMKDAGIDVKTRVGGRGQVYIVGPDGRFDWTVLDPEVFRKDSQLGVPGLMRAWRAGNVEIGRAHV